MTLFNLSLPMLVLAVLAFVAANWLLVTLLVLLAPKIGLLDRPNERSLHTKVTPRGGGLVLVLVMAGVLGAGVGLGGLSGGLRVPVLIYLGAALFIATVSLVDDFKSLSAGFRFVCQLAVAIAAATGVASFAILTLPGLGPLPVGWAGVGLTVFWIIGMTNVYNFMDGIDGIAGVQGVVAGLAWSVAGIWLVYPAITVLGLLLAAGCLAFLFHNWSPARIFMGDVGSAFLGYTFAVLPLLLLRSIREAGGDFPPGGIPVFAFLAVWPFVGDGLYTFVRRARGGEAVWEPHRTHLYQRLVRSGWSHARVSTLYGAWATESALAGLCWLRGPGPAAYGLAGVALGALAAVYFLVAHRERNTGTSA